MTSASNAPATSIRQNDVLTLEYPGIAKIQAFFQAAAGDAWQIRVTGTAISKIPLRQFVTAKYIKHNLIYRCITKVLSFDRETGLAMISRPEITDSRPVRGAKRINIELPAAIIIMNQDASEGFKFRRDNLITNISMTGIMLAAKEPLTGVRDIMVLTALHEDAHHEDQQVYFPARVVRPGEVSTHADYPHTYGVKFGPVFPHFKRMLTDYMRRQNPD